VGAPGHDEALDESGRESGVDLDGSSVPSGRDGTVGGGCDGFYCIALHY
jgi:hypothetical protein